MKHGTHEQWRERWGINECEDVWSPVYGWGIVADTFAGGNYPVLVTYKTADKDGNSLNVGRYYNTEGYAQEGAEAIYPKAYAIALDAAADWSEGARRAKARNADTEVHDCKFDFTGKTVTPFHMDGPAWLLILFMFLFCSAGNNDSSKPPIRSKKEDTMIRAHKMLGESWKRVAQTTGMTPAQAFVDFSSNEVLLNFIDDIGNVYGVAMEELKRRMENGQYDSEGENHGDGNTDV